MASVGSKEKKSRARVLLDFALGEKRVSLGGLSFSEFDVFLEEALKIVDLREIRGFVPPRDLLTIKPEAVIGRTRIHTLDIEQLGAASELRFSAYEFEKNPPDLDSHVLRISRGWNFHDIVYKRYESEEETQDRETAQSWGNSSYHASGKGTFLVVCRPPNHTGAEQNLAIIDFFYRKVPHKPKHVVHKVHATFLPIGKFRHYFGQSYPKMAWEIISELRTACSRTAADLRSQATAMERDETNLKRITESTTS